MVIELVVIDVRDTCGECGGAANKTSLTVTWFLMLSHTPKNTTHARARAHARTHSSVCMPITTNNS